MEAIALQNAALPFLKYTANQSAKNWTNYQKYQNNENPFINQLSVISYQFSSTVNFAFIELTIKLSMSEESSPLTLLNYSCFLAFYSNLYYNIFIILSS